MKVKPIVLSLVLIVILLGCKEQKKTTEPEATETSEEENVRELKTATGKTFRLTETHPVGASLSTLKIETAGFEHEFNETLTDIDPVTEVFLADVDENGFEEIYIVSTAAGTGAYTSLHAFASNGDQSVSSIYVPEISEDDLATGNLFEGYRGSDGILIWNGVLIREFYKYKEGDPAHEPSGDRIAVAYELVAGEASYRLSAKATQTASGKLVKNCLGAFLATDKGNFQICNDDAKRLQALSDGDPIEMNYTNVQACAVKEEAMCKMAYPTAGYVKIVSLID